VVIVTFNSAEVIERCLAALDDDIRSGFAEVVVVDNGSTDSTIKIVQARQRVRLVTSEYNVGFGAGNNLGAVDSDAEFLLFLNPDTIVAPSAIVSLIAALENEPSIGIIGPAIQDSDGKVSLSSFRYVTPAFSIWIALGLQKLFPLNRTDGKIELRRHPPKEACRVDRLLGAAIAMRRDVFEAIGGFDENFFLYSEEEDLCKRVQERGFSVVYYPVARMTHIGGHSAIPESPITIASSVWSRQYFVRKHYGMVGEYCSRVAWGAAISLKLLIASFLPNYRKLRHGYFLALKSLISADYYIRRVRPPRGKPTGSR